METLNAILLRRTRLTDTSLIVTWLTAEAGRIKTVAKGARAQKSRFAGVLDLFYLCEIQFSRSRQSELHALREATLKDAFPGIRSDYDRVALAGYFVELVELVTESDHEAMELFDLLSRALAYLHTHAANRRALEHFESELCRSLGIHSDARGAAQTLRNTYHRLPQGRDAILSRVH